MPDYKFYTRQEVDILLNLKADKVANAVENDLVTLAADGNILDSGLDAQSLLFGNLIDGGTF